MVGPARKFSLLDAMVFVAATAVGLGITRSLTDLVSITRNVLVRTDIGAASPVGRLTTTRAMRVYYFLDTFSSGIITPWSQRIAFWPGPLLAAWTLALFGLDVRASRRSKRRIVRHPGSAAGLAVLLALAATATLSPQLLFERTIPAGSLEFTWSSWWPEFWFSIPRTAAFGVVVSWSVLAWGGRWAPVPGWHDRLGRALGAAWIALAMSSLATDWFPTLAR